MVNTTGNITEIAKEFKDVFSNSTAGPGYFIEYLFKKAFHPFTDFLPIVIAVFVIAIAYIRTKDVGTVVFMTLAYIGIYSIYMQEPLYQVLASIVAMVLAGLLWKALGKRLGGD